jgi:hypothetical protein
MRIFRLSVSYFRLVSVAYATSLLLLLSAARFPQTHTVEYSKLNSKQQTLASGYLSAANKQWGDLHPSEQVEFAGATQGIGTWWQFEPEAQPPQPGLEQVTAVAVIRGDVPGAPSPKQFNLQVSWNQQSENAFAHGWAWGKHASQLHPGYHGYNQNKAGDPFLGIVTLFCDHDASKGQIHIDLRDTFGHYLPDNANIAKNYREYCAWYGKIDGYVGDCNKNGGAEVPSQLVRGSR